MKIDAVTTAVVEANFDYTIVRVSTEDGHYGVGEAFFAPGLPAIIADVGSLILGRDPRDIGTLIERMHLAISASSGPSGAGAAMHAVSGIETALWDLLGKLWNEPVWRLLGGRYRTHVPVYVDLHAGEGLGSIDNLLRLRQPFWATSTGTTDVGDFYWVTDEPEALTRESILARVLDARAAGYRTVKLDIDVFDERRLASDASLTTRVITRLADTARWLRDQVDPDVDIAYDCHWRFDVPAARTLTMALSDASPLWLEDPVPADAEGLRLVAEAGSVPIASGENAYRLPGVQALAANGGLHVATPDVQKVGGIRESHRIGTWCSDAGIGFAPHCIASPVGLAAAAHVMAATPSVMCVEFHGSDLDFWDDIVNEPVIENGAVEMSMQPGLGVTLNLDTITRYAKRGHTVFGKPITE